MTIEEVLESEGKYVGPVKGVSMLPMLVAEEDSVVIYAQNGPFNVLDIVLYKRGKDYVLHRIVKIHNKGYIIRGDNCYYDERVKEEQILGVLKEFYRNDKHILCMDKDYLIYSRRHVKYYFIRKLKRKVKQFIKRVLRVPHKIITIFKNKGLKNGRNKNNK